MHEHLDQFGIINMNGRVYDPLTAMFFSPDPFVQAPGNWLNFNRYAYCYGNPFKYTDPSGEFIGTAFTAIFGLGKAVLNGIIVPWFVGFKDPTKAGKMFEEAWTDYGKKVSNAWKIDIRLFKTDPNNTPGNQAWELISRFTYQIPQTLVGNMGSHGTNIFGNMNSVDYKYGATVLQVNGSFGAVALGNYIIGDKNIAADPNNSLFQHEYGHYLQSQEMGWAFLSRVGIPSLMSASMKDGYHKFQPFEQDANRRAFMYFNENVPGFYQTMAQYYAQGVNRIKGWNFYSNPLDINHTAKRNIFYDYYNLKEMALVNSLSLRAKWYDYLDPTGLIIGIFNGRYYKNHRVK